MSKLPGERSWSNIQGFHQEMTKETVAPCQLFFKILSHPIPFFLFDVYSGSFCEVKNSASFQPVTGYDVEPGESSDEEGGSSEGIRLRVRLSRKQDDKWGSLAAILAINPA